MNCGNGIYFVFLGEPIRVLYWSQTIQKYTLGILCNVLRAILECTHIRRNTMLESCVITTIVIV